jgi:hypothetical protein
MKITPDQGETVGWPRFIETLATAWHALPGSERTRTVIFTSNYGEAGAIDILGHAKGLPDASSGHNGFGEWSRPAGRDAHALVVGYNGPADAAPYFRDCRTLATINDGVGLNNDEQGLPLLLCRPAAAWTILWPHLVHLN